MKLTATKVIGMFMFTKPSMFRLKHDSPPTNNVCNHAHENVKKDIVVAYLKMNEIGWTIRCVSCANKLTNHYEKQMRQTSTQWESWREEQNLASNLGY